jgi:hypothetical protein
MFIILRNHKHMLPVSVYRVFVVHGLGTWNSCEGLVVRLVYCWKRTSILGTHCCLLSLWRPCGCSWCSSRVRFLHGNVDLNHPATRNSGAHLHRACCRAAFGHICCFSSVANKTLPGHSAYTPLPSRPAIRVAFPSAFSVSLLEAYARSRCRNMER